MNLRKLFGISIAIVVVLLLLVAIYNTLAQPRLELSAPVGSTVTVCTVSDGKQVQKTKLSSSKTTLSIGQGDYMVTILNGTAAQLATVHAALFQTTKMQFTNSSQLHANATAQATAFNAQGSDDFVTYVNTTKRSLMKLDATGNAITLAGSDGATTVTSMQPIANGQAIVQINTKLYILRSGQLSTLATDGFPSTIQSIVIGANPLQSSFVVAVNQTLYRYASADAKPEKIITPNKQFDQVAYGGNQAIVFSTAMPDSVENLRSSYTAFAVDPIAINLGTKAQHIISGGPMIVATISPDGKQATLQTQGQNSHISLYNLSNYQQKSVLPNASIVPPLWLNGSQYLYVQGSSIWKYTTSNQTAATIATLPSGMLPTSLTYDQAKQKYYVTSYNDEQTASIFRLDAISAGVGNDVAQLALSQTPGLNYNLSYYNITQPTLVIQTYDTSSRTHEQYIANTQQARQDAIRYLQQHSLDPNKLTILYNPKDPL